LIDDLLNTSRIESNQSLQPSYSSFDILPQLDEASRRRWKRDRKARRGAVCRRAAAALDEYLRNAGASG